MSGGCVPLSLRIYAIDGSLRKFIEAGRPCMLYVGKTMSTVYYADAVHRGAIAKS